MRSSKSALALAFVVSAVTGLIAWQAYKACLRIMNDMNQMRLEVPRDE